VCVVLVYVVLVLVFAILFGGIVVVLSFVSLSSLSS